MNEKKYELKVKNSISYLKINSFSELNKDVKALFSTKEGGYSKGYYKSMNLSYKVGDESKIVDKNFNLFSRVTNIKIQNSVMTDIRHRNDIIVVDENTDIEEDRIVRTDSGYDGIITNLMKVPLMSNHADCTPLYFYDSKLKVIGLAHAGWKGTAMNISKAMIERYVNRYCSDPSNIHVAIGPTICGSCYEVGAEVIDTLKLLPISLDWAIYKKDNSKYNIDMQEINRRLLIEAGVKPNNIYCCNICTKENSILFFSHRKHFDKRGSQVAVIQID